MIGLLIAFVGGGMLGAALHALALKFHRNVEVDSQGDVASEEREDFSGKVALRRALMQREITNFADRIAGDDPVLREHLRIFEQGDRS